MKPTTTELLTKYSASQSTKSTWDTEYRKVFEYCMPARDGYQKAQGSEQITEDWQDRRENLYSSVGEQSANEFVNTMQETLAPPQTDWINIDCGPQIKEAERKKKNETLEEMSNIANQYKNNSSFDMAFSEFCYDVFAGTGCLLVTKGKGNKKISYKAIPIREYSIEEGCDGEVRAVYRKYTMKQELVKASWPELSGMEITKESADKEIELLESTYYDYDLNTWHYSVTDIKDKAELLHRESATNPFIVLRWNKCAGEPYGRGVGITALNDIRTLNLIKFYSLRAFAYSIPPLLVQEDGFIDVDNMVLTPLSLNVVSDTSSSIVPLDISPNYNAESYKTQDLEMQIKKDTFGYTLPDDSTRQMTAEEVRTRKMDIQRKISSVYGRLMSEFQIPLVKRTIEVLGTQGALGEEYLTKFDVKNINGLIFKVNVITPIAKILKHGEAQGILAAVGTLAQFDPTGAVLYQSVKMNELVPHYLDLTGLPNKFINSTEEIDAEQEKQAKAQQGAVVEEAKLDVEKENAKETGKAEAKGLESELIK